MKRLFLALGGLLFVAGCSGLGSTSVHYTDFGADYAEKGGTYLTPENHPDGWGQSDCLGCHQNFKHTMATVDLSVDQYQKLIDDAVNAVGVGNAIGVCSACHGTNGVSGVQRQCLVCHDQMGNLIHFYRGTSQRTHALHDFNGNGRIDDFDCTVCHWQPDMDGLVEPGTDFAHFNGISYKNVQDLCLTCHSNTWGALSGEPLADTNGDGKADAAVSPKEAPPNVASLWSGDWHGQNDYTTGEKSFKPIDLSGQLLFHVQHAPLECSQCHNPHASNNDNLIIEKVGETLLADKAVVQQDNTSVLEYVVVDPRSQNYFKDLYFEGNVTSVNATYDLSNATQLQEYVNLPVNYTQGATVLETRENQASLCAACHDGTYSYAPANGLGLPIDVKTHMNPDQVCSQCHTHGGTF
ncbi:cytochrome c3 family protein [Thermovibrio ammonificans]